MRLLSWALLATASQLVLGACSAGFTEYTDGDAWIAGLRTGSGKHCLLGTSASPITVSGKRVEVSRGVEAEAHHVIFRDHDAGQSAGAFVFADITAKFTANNCEFRGGSATTGGAVFVNNGDASITCNTCTFASNNGQIGGAVMINIDGTFTCNTCTFDSNTATMGGAAFINAGGTFVGNTVTFTGNTATQEGGEQSVSQSVSHYQLLPRSIGPHARGHTHLLLQVQSTTTWAGR